MSRLLVVDDEPNVLYALERGLGSATLEVVTARTGGQGLALVRRQRPDAVLLDVRLPDMSGLDVLRQLRRAEPELPVLLLTADSRAETARAAVGCGAFELLLKPVDLRRLRAAVGRALGAAGVPAGSEAAGVPERLAVGCLAGQAC